MMASIGHITVKADARNAADVQYAANMCGLFADVVESEEMTPEKRVFWAGKMREVRDVLDGVRFAAVKEDVTL